MAEKLGVGAAFPFMNLNVVGGGKTGIPTDITTAYQIVLFYRGHW